MAEKITGEMMIREVTTQYPGIEAVLALHGLEGCGGPKGPLEPIAFFAKVHRVDVDMLLKDLNDFVEGKVTKPISAEVKARAAPLSNLYKLFMYSGLLVLVTAGAGLGALNLADMAFKGSFVTLWPSLTQVHAHSQILGWVGLFIMGVAYTVVPRLKGTVLWREDLAVASFWLVISGLVIRMFAQPLDASIVSAIALVLSGALELAGVALFLRIILKTMSTGTMAQEFFENYLKAGLVWMLLGVIGNFILVTLLPIKGTAVIPESYLAPYVTSQLLGFITMMVLGIGWRTHPEFLGLKSPDARYQPLLFWVLNIAIALLVAGEVVQAFVPGMAVQVINLIAGTVIGLTLLAQFALINPFRKPIMDLKALGVDRSYEKYIKTAYLWLIAGALLLIGISLYQGITGHAVPYYWLTAFRHVMAVGFVTTMIMGQASKIVPVFAGAWLYSPLMLMPIYILLTFGNLLRVVSQIEAGMRGGPSYIVMGISGFLLWIATILFSFNLWQSMEGKGKAPVRRIAVTGHGPVTAEMIVADVIDKYPETLDVFLKHGFTPLSNPVARRTMAKMITIEKATQIHPMDVNVLLEALNTAVHEKSLAETK